ncbi:putative neurobeachin/beige protein [Trypanosoma conorhini]|uniref:Putative neurobeachin/beige protein n=1 Tax=Trypanosoma conorhini TaxID=83891 RepID=A0A422PPA3_9TRYP|nr:putative neurobeachin/beige protein [Trypanosoma conorhini]RNF19576.1 putative neurobeachin/beige protein [Trypanosoma conorhini]
MDSNCEEDTSCLTRGSALGSFCVYSARLRFNPLDHELERQTVRLLRELLAGPLHHVAAWDAFRRTRLLNVVLEALGSRSRLSSLASEGSSLADYVRVVELAAEANPHACMRQLTLDGTSDAGLFAIFPLLVRIPLLDGGLTRHRRCINSYVRTIVLLLSDARNCALLARIKLSPMQLLLDALAQSPSNRHEVALLALRGILQILLGTAELTKRWVEDFALYGGPAMCLSTITRWCGMDEDPNSPLCEPSTFLFDILCLLISLPDSGRSPCHSLYLYLRSFHWEMDEAEPDPSVYRSTVGMFGLRVMVRAALLAKRHRPVLFRHLVSLLICTIRLGNADIVAAGLVSEELVDVVRQYMQCLSEPEEAEVGGVIATVVRLCLTVCASPAAYAKQKGGAPQLCALVVELASISTTIILRCTIQTLILLGGLVNEIFFFTQLVAAKLFEELNKRVQNTSSPCEIHLVIRLVKEICTRVPALQGAFLRMAGTIVDLMRTEVRNGPRLLLECADLLSLVMLESEEGALQIRTLLLQLLAQTNFQSSGSIITSCWALQTCIRSVQRSSIDRVYPATEVNCVLVCLHRLCVSMGASFSSELMTFDFCVLYDEMMAYHRHRRDACGVDRSPRRYLLMCDFLLLALHLLSLLHVNAPAESRRGLSRQLGAITAAGPFLQCRLYTSIIARAFLGMCSLSSLVLLGELQAAKEAPSDVVPVTRQSLTAGWVLYSSYGDDCFACGRQRIVHPEYLQSFFAVLQRQSQTAARALLGVSATQLLLDVFCNSLENIYALVERGVATLLSEVWAVAVAADEGYKESCIQHLATVTAQVGVCGFSHTAMLFLLQMCLRQRTADSVEYANKATATVFTTWRVMLRQSMPSSQPMSFVGISVGFPAVTRFQPTAVQRLKRGLGLHGGIDIPMPLTVPKPEGCISAVLWLLVEQTASPPVGTAEFVLLSFFLDQNKIAVLLLLSKGGELSLRLLLPGYREQRSSTVPVPGIAVPRERWCMVSMSIVAGHRASTAIRAKLRLEVRISLHAVAQCGGSSSTEVGVGVEMSLGVLGRVNPWPWEVNAVSLAAAYAPPAVCPQQLLLGSLGMFAGPLSKLELVSLFAMGSDNLFSLSFVDRSFVVGLYPTLANMAEQEVGMLTEEMVLLAAMWRQGGTPTTKDQPRISSASFPFAGYCSKEHLPVVVGVFGGELCLATHMERRGAAADVAECQDADVTPWNTAADRLTRIGSVTRVPLRLSTHEDTARRFGSMWVEANGPRFHSVTPVYSALDAVGGLPFFAWLASLQAPHSTAFAEVWKCACAVVLRHSPESLLCPAPSHGGRCLVILLRAMLHARIAISETIAASLCDAVGNRILVRTDLLSLMLDFTLWSQDVGAFRVVLRKLQQYMMDPQYGQFNSQILQYGGNSERGVGDCYALEKFLLHLLMHFAGQTNGSWDTSIIAYAMPFVSTLCRTASHLRQVMQAVICLVVAEEPPPRLSVEWALGLLGAVHSVMEVGETAGLPDADLATGVVALLKCSEARVRCRAIPLFSYLLLSRAQVAAAVDVYLARRALFPNSPCLSKQELDTIAAVVRRSARLGEAVRARALIFFLFALFLQMPVVFQVEVMQLLRDVMETKELSSHDLLYGAGTGEYLMEPLPSHLIGTFHTLAMEGSTVAGDFVELLTATAVQMIKHAWGAADTICGQLLGDALWAIFQTLLREDDYERVCVTDVDVNRAGMWLTRFSAPCFHMFAALAKNGCPASFLNDYFSFLRIQVAIVLLLSRYESDGQGCGAATIADAKEIDQTTLVHTYSLRLGKTLVLKTHQIGLRLTLLLLEAAQTLFFGLQAGDMKWLTRKRAGKISEELLLLQWRVIATALYDAEKTDDDVVKELLLLHLAHSGLAEYDVHHFPWGRRKPLAEPPDAADWRHLWLSPNTVLMELIKKAPGEALKECAPWLIVLRAAFSFLHAPLRSNLGRFYMSLSICRLIRYNATIWSLVRRGVSPSSTAELEATLTTEEQDLLAEDAATLGDSLWGIELSRSGVAAMEKYVTATRSTAVVALKHRSRQRRFLLPSMDSQQTPQFHDQAAAEMHQVQASIWQEAELYRKSVEEDGSAILAAHAAYRFSLLPWWGHCVSLYSHTPVPLNRWELDRFLGPEWQRMRLRRFIHDVRISRTEGADQLIRPVYRDGMASMDDVRLLECYSATAVPQLLPMDALGPDPLAVKCKLVLPMHRVPIMLYVASKHVSYVVECFESDLAQLGKAATNPSFPPDASGPSTFVRTHEFATPLPASFKYRHEVPCFRRVVSVASIRAVWPRRNLLQPCALELLLSTGETVFLAFDSEAVRKSVLEHITECARPHLDRTLTLTESNLKLWRNWWCEGRISNFHYLMYLNFAAGRSYGDLRQYPVFPHVVADFVSDTLDLSSPAVYRRLDKPMGAQTADRELRAVQRYREMAALPKGECSASIDLVPHHHGSHYSPVGGALHFLVRVQPFSDYFVDMNSSLDDAGRVFDSMAAAYFISTGKDVKELLPELYCLPEMFVNSNRIPFGVRQDGRVVDDVQLPPWASTPRELTQKLRQALEGRHTSENLHFWIDLVFGYKQRGKEAVAAVNVFHPLTYEGSIDLSTIKDPVLLSSHETQIDCYGQVPLQLFTQQHKPRGKSTEPPLLQSPCPTLRYEASSSRACVVLHPDGLVPILNAAKVEGTVVVFPRTKPVTAARGAEEASEWKLPLTQSRPIALPRHCLPFTVVHDQLKDCLCIRGNCIVILDGKDLSREVCSLHVGNGMITAYTVDPPNVYVGMASGAIHALGITYEEWTEVEPTLQEESGERQGTTHASERAPYKEMRTVRNRGAVRRRVCVLYGHTAPVTALCVSAEWGILVSTAEDHRAAVWDTTRLVLLRAIPSPCLAAKYPESLFPGNAWQQRAGADTLWHYDLIAVNAKEGDIVLAGRSPTGAHAVRLYTLNGSLAAAYGLGEEPATALLTVGGLVFVAQGTLVRVLRERDLLWRSNLSHPGLEDTITSLALSPNGTILAACDRRSTLVTWKVSL